MQQTRQDVAPTVTTMAAEMARDELTMRAIAHGMGLQDPQVWRVLPKGRVDILLPVAADLPIRQAKAVGKHDRLHKRTARARVEGQLARMLALDFEPRMKAWRRDCAAQDRYWTREQPADPLCELPARFEPMDRDRGPAIAIVWAVYETTLKGARAMDWTQEQATMELTAWLQVISLDHQERRRDRRSRPRSHPRRLIPHT